MSTPANAAASSARASSAAASSVAASNAAAATTRARARPWLTPRWRKAVLVLHILGAGAWIGIEVIFAVLVLVGWLSPDAQLAGLAFQALGTFVVTPMLTAGLVTLATGLLLGLGTQWGLTRFWWVFVKLVLTVVMAVLIVVALQPDMPAVVAQGEAIAAGAAPGAELRTLFFPPAVSLAALTFATTLAVAKPWGRMRGAGGRSQSRW